MNDHDFFDRIHKLPRFHGTGAQSTQGLEWLESFIKATEGATNDFRCSTIFHAFVSCSEADAWHSNLPQATRRSWTALTAAWRAHWPKSVRYLEREREENLLHKTYTQTQETWQREDLTRLITTPYTERFRLTEPPVSTFMYVFPQPTLDELQLREVDDEIAREQLEVLNELLRSAEEEVTARRREAGELPRTERG